MKSICAVLGKSENALVNDAVLSILNMIEQGDTVTVPKLVILAQAAHAYDANPPHVSGRQHHLPPQAPPNSSWPSTVPSSSH
ncbi:MAG: hypothetical protein AAGK14_15465 [Verrucomicrobiota bacterium]